MADIGILGASRKGIQQDFVPVFSNKLSPTKVFRKRLDEWEKQNNLAKVPWCRPCAYFELEDQMDRCEKEKVRHIISSNPEEVNEKIAMKIVKDFDFKPFTGVKNFTLVSEEQIKERDVVSIGGRKTLKVFTIGKWQTYECDRAHKISIAHLDDEENTKTTNKKVA